MAETEWTVATLKELYDRAFHDLARQFDRTIADIKDRFNGTIEDRDVRVNLALSAAKEAVTKAEAADEKRFALLNEFRGQQAEEARKYAPVQLVEHQFKELVERIGRLEIDISRLQGRALALGALGTVFGGIVGALIIKVIH